MICPCKNCICVPICRHKKFGLLFDCELLRLYEPNSSDPYLRDVPSMFALQYTLKPTRWKYGYNNKSYSINFPIVQLR